MCTTNSAAALKSLYEESLVVAFREAGLIVNRQVPLPVWFRNQKFGDAMARVSA